MTASFENSSASRFQNGKKVVCIAKPSKETLEKCLVEERSFPGFVPKLSEMESWKELNGNFNSKFCSGQLLNDAANETTKPRTELSNSAVILTDQDGWQTYVNLDPVMTAKMTEKQTTESSLNSAMFLIDKDGWQTFVSPTAGIVVERETIESSAMYLSDKDGWRTYVSLVPIIDDEGWLHYVECR